MEFLSKLIELIRSPEFYALIVALSGLLLAIAKFLQGIEPFLKKREIGDGPISNWFMRAAGEAGKIAEWLAPGNADTKNHPEAVKTALYWVDTVRDKFKR